MADFQGGIGIDSVTSAGSSAVDATPMPRLAQHTVYIITSGGGSTGVLFPQSGAEIGDTLEFYPDNGSAAYNVYSGAASANGAPGNQLSVSIKRYTFTSAGWFG